VLLSPDAAMLSSALVFAQLWGKPRCQRANFCAVTPMCDGCHRWAFSLMLKLCINDAGERGPQVQAPTRYAIQPTLPTNHKRTNKKKTRQPPWDRQASCLQKATGRRSGVRRLPRQGFRYSRINPGFASFLAERSLLRNALVRLSVYVDLHKGAL